MVALIIVVVALAVIVGIQGFMIMQNTRSIQYHTQAINDINKINLIQSDRLTDQHRRLQRLDGVTPCICLMTPEDPRPKPDCPRHGI